MEMLVLAIFCAVLLVSILLDISIVAALLAGLAIFLFYGRKKGFSWPSLLRTCLGGISTTKNILITFVLIGMLTAAWRAAGTIPSIVCYGTAFIRPSVFLLMAFLLNALVSVLTGTSFGTSATMGVICGTIGLALNVPMYMTGGAVLGGAFVGDRCSPLSTSALLVAEQTGTSIYDNIRNMLRTALIPFIATCGIYLVLGMQTAGNAAAPDLSSMFSAEFRLGMLPLLPAAIVFGLAFFRVNVKRAMPVSILAALLIAGLFQKMQLPFLLKSLIFGFHSRFETLAPMVNGGGVVSMFRPLSIICISSCYSGIFKATGLMQPMKKYVLRLADAVGRYAAVLVSSLLLVCISCNQTLAIMLETQLCEDLYRKKDETNSACDEENTGFTPDSENAAAFEGSMLALDKDESAKAFDFEGSALALDIEDSAVLVSAIIPWSIAGALPLATIGAPTSSILLACYLYLVPVWRLICSRHRSH